MTGFLMQYTCPTYFSNTSTLLTFLGKVRSCMPPTHGHSKVAYHCFAHCVDVLQRTCASLHILGDVLDEDKRAAFVVAALTHDLKHPGLNNAVYKATQPQHESLEHMHAHYMEELLRDSEMMLIEASNMDALIQLTRRLILTTDLAKHQALMASKEQVPLEVLLLKASDVSNVSREFHINYQWSQRLRSENKYCVRAGDKLGVSVMEVGHANDSAGFITWMTGLCSMFQHQRLQDSFLV